MKYYIGKIREIVGELEFETTIRFKAYQGHADEYLDQLARSWRLEHANFDDFLGGYDHGEVVVNAGSFIEVPKEVFDAVAEIITYL